MTSNKFESDWFKNQNVISYTKMKVCVCVCMYVRPPAAGPTQPITLKFGMGSSFHPGSAPSQGVTPEKPWRVNNWVGASKQKLFLRVGLPSKILFVGSSPKPGARRVHPTKWGCMLWELGRDQQTKVAPRGGFVYKNLFVGVSPQPKACRVLRSICTGLYHDEIVK